MRWRLRDRHGQGDGGRAELDARLSETWEAAAVAVGKMLDLPAGKEALLASSGLLQEGAADLRAPAGMTRRLARRRRRRRLALRSAAAVTAALTAGAVALAVAEAPDAGHNGTKRPAVDSAYVVKRVGSALSAAGPAEIAQMTVTASRATPGGTTSTATSEEWSYGVRRRSVTYSPAGNPVYDESVSASSVYTVVSYPARTWARQPGLGRPAAPEPGPPSCKTVITPFGVHFGLSGTGISAISVSPLPAASDLRTVVSCGNLTVVGRQRVDGTEAIELTSRPGSRLSETIWVSPDTYLPVRVVISPPPGQPVLGLTVDITWLPPTPQNLARLTVPIPAGFRQVPPRDEHR